MRPLRAERYAKHASPSLPDFLTKTLPYLGYSEALDFYEKWVPKLNPSEIALLGCNDRFFLFTGMLNRADGLHPWIYERAREVEAEPDGHLDLWSRYHFKSSICTFAGTIQELLHDPEVRVCIFANTKEIAVPFVTQIRDELDRNEELKLTYPDVLWRDAKERKTAGIAWTADAITVKRRQNYKEATVEAHALNALPTGKHFSILHYDDLINERNVTNPAQIKHASTQVELSFPCGIGEKTRKRFVGTRYSYADSYGQLLENKVAEARLHPATDDGTLNGNPVLMSKDAWEQVKRESRSTISAQFLQNPMAGNENTFRVEWLRGFILRPSMMNIYIMGDPSKGKSKTSDRTAIAVIGTDTQGHKFLVDGFCHRMPLSQRWQRLDELHKKWAEMPGVQSIKVGWERYGMQTDLEYFEEKMEGRSRRFEIEELNWANDASGKAGDPGSQSKTKRVERLEPEFRNGHFFVPLKVWHPVVATATNGNKPTAVWHVDEPTGEIRYLPAPPAYAEENKARANGEHWRIFEPIIRKDEDGHLYDLVRVFFQEFAFFPFSPRDDLIDAMSRVYDLEPLPAQRYESVQVDDYADA